MTSDDAHPGGYAARLLPASGIGAASRWVVPYASEGYQPYLALTFRIGGDTFHRVWAYCRDQAGEAYYAFLGDTSVSFPGAAAPDLEWLARRALQLVPELRTSDRSPGRSAVRPFRPKVRRAVLAPLGAPQ